MLTKQLMKQIGDDMSAAVKAIEEKYNITITRAGSRFGDETATVKFDLTLNDENGNTEDQFVKAFKANAQYIGFSEGDLGKSFVSSGKEFKLHGMTPRRCKYTMIATDGKGDLYKFTINDIKAFLNIGLSDKEIQDEINEEIQAEFIN